MKVLVLGLAIVGLVMIFSSVGEALDESLILYCPFEEGEGDTTEDVTGNNEPGTLNGVEWVDGKYGGGLYFDGEHRFVEIPNSGLFDPENITVEMWLNPSDFDYAWPTVVCHNDDVSGWYVQIDGASRGVYFCGAGAGNWILSNPLGIETEKFQHLAITSDWEETNFFLNGELIQTISQSILMEKYEGSMILGKALTCCPYKGILDEVAIYSRILTQEEIKKDMTEGITMAVEPSDKLAATWGSIKVKY